MVIIYLILFIFSLSVEASDSFSYSGRLVTHAGSPAPGPAKLTFDLIYTSQPSNILCSQTLNEVKLSHGVFHVKLDFPTCNLETIFKSTPDNHTVSIRVTDNTSGLNKVYSYQAIHSVPFAFVSQSSKQLDSMNAASGEVLAWNGDKWAPINPSSLVTSTAPEGDAGGALTGTYPNPGLAPISQSNVVNLVSDLTSKIGLSHLSATLPLVYNNATGEFSLDNSAIVKLDELEVLPNGDGLIDRSSGILSARTCDSGEVLKWFAPGGWTCSADSSEDIDKLPLAGGTLTGDLILSTQLQIKNGAAHSIILKTPLSDTNYTLVLPPSAGGTNQVLTTNGGILTWETPATSAAPSGAAGGVLNGTYPNPGLNDIPQSKVTDLVTDLASKIGLNNLSATAPLNYNSGAFSISEATVSSAGTLSATDKTKLDGLEPIPNLPGLVERYGTTLRNRSCSPNEVLKWDGSLGWICAIDDDKDETKLPLAGGTLTGPLVLSGSPGADLHATTKLYVDTLVSNNASKWTNITGGIHYSGGDVGVGTSSPSAKLHVNSGNIEVSNFNVRKNRYGFHYDQGNDTTVYYHNLGRVSYNDGDMHISGSLSGHDSLTQGKAIIDVFINARNAPYINGVVFGDPMNSNIEVYEDASANLNVYLKTTIFSQVNLDIAVSGQATSYLTDSTKTTIIPTGTLVANVQDHAKLYVKNSGNVGIGTSAPTNKLHVEGDIAVTGDLKMAGGDSYIWTNGTGTGYTGIYDQANNRVLIHAAESSGNVGIGKNNPQAKLDVGGTVAVNGNPAIVWQEIATPLTIEFSVVTGIQTIALTGVPAGARYILADVFATMAAADHNNFLLGRGIISGQNYVGARGQQPSTVFGNQQFHAVRLHYPGDSDAYSPFYGTWYSSQHIPIYTNSTMQFLAVGNNSTAGWIYMVIRAYSL